MRLAFFGLLSSGCTLCVSVDRIEVAPDAGRDAAPDAAQCTGAPADAPVLVSPWNGAHQGNVHAPGTLRPRFRWEAVSLPDGSAPAYEVALDDSCEPGAHADCAMDDPELDVTGIAGTELVPDADLPVSTEPPVGARYAWRVRGCDPCSGACGPWSVGRYLDVGREQNDIDGDGYADVIVGALGRDGALGDQGAAFLYRGGPDGIAPDAATTLHDPGVGQPGTLFGHGMAIVGDIDADGYADAVIGSYGADAPEGDEGVARVWLGGPEGLAPVADVTLDNPHDQASSGFGIDIADGGDLDADGFRDFVIDAYLGGADAGRLYVFRGGPQGPSPWPWIAMDAPVVQPDAFFGVSTAVGDLDGDGYSDLVAASVIEDAPEVDSGAIYVFLGGPNGPASSPDQAIGNPFPVAGDHFGYLAPLGDVNGDGLGDVVAGAPLFDGAAIDEGIAYVFFGAAGGLDAASAIAIASPAVPGAGAAFGAHSSGGLDADGDGALDLYVAAPENAVGPGQVFLYLGDGTGAFDTMPIVVDSSAPELDARFGTDLGCPGDVNGDGYADFVVGAYTQNVGVADTGAAYVFLGGPGGLSDAPPTTLAHPAAISDYFGLDVSGATPGL